MTWDFTLFPAVKEDDDFKIDVIEDLKKTNTKLAT